MSNSNNEILAIRVYLERRTARELVGTLKRSGSGFEFQYDDNYLYSDNSIPVGPDLPLTKKVHKTKVLFPSFLDRIPSKKNPAYDEYCRNVGIAPDEADLLILLAFLGKKGPSSFILSPEFKEDFTDETVAKFRRELKLSIREFAEAFDFSYATISRIETQKTSGRESLKRLELYYKFPSTAIFELSRNAAKINEDRFEYALDLLKKKKNKGPQKK